MLLLLVLSESKKRPLFRDTEDSGVRRQEMEGLCCMRECECRICPLKALPYCIAGQVFYFGLANAEKRDQSHSTRCLDSSRSLLLLEGTRDERGTLSELLNGIPSHQRPCRAYPNPQC